MARYKALLIGAAAYDAPGISSLSFVRDDLERMAAALTVRGFHQVNLARAPWFTPNIINGEVTTFLSKAESGDRLLVMLSGHGVHSEGRDYLVPEDIRPELSPFTSGCVEIDWRDELENSRAAQVVFLIDACREGIQNDTMATSSWSNRKIATALRRKVAYVYACSQAEVARFVRDADAVVDGQDVGTTPGETFSLFSRTVTDLLAGPVNTLGEFGPAAQERIDALHTAYGKTGAPQRVRVLTEDEHDDFPLFPPAETTADLHGAERTWADTAVTHPAWKLTPPSWSATVDVLKEVCGTLAARYARACAEAEPRIAEDPWYDRELADRVTERVGFLLLRLAEETELSPTEAALLTILPFAAQAHWTRQAADRRPPDAELDDFLTSFPRLGRRLRTLRQNSSWALSDIRWWGYHRWLVRQPEAFDLGFLGCDERQIPATAPAWIGQELAADRLVAHLKEQRIAPSAIPGTARSTALREDRPVAPSTPHEHTVREWLVSALFKAAHALAIDPADLPEVLVEHLGISDSVSMEDLRATVRQSHWVAAGAGRSLSALCGHPAIELALKRHAETVDALLRDISKEAARSGSHLTPLGSLPAFADAQQVRPSGATPAELSSGIRFRLADDRVQELLMGEQLYGDRALAIRELYQNALDALRYRTARTEFLRRTDVPVPDWTGEIVFTEGTDDSGRRYLECSDNGIGMGVIELSRAFAQGGSRYVDLPEYLEEGALWAALDPPVELVPVSRFGLGVLSYFMIADELTVMTCRLDREGRPGRLLKVTIAGPGNLFRVEDLGPGREAGTKVRLHCVQGQPMPSSGEELAKHLWVSPYRVVAQEATRTRRWEAGKLVVEAAERSPKTPTERLRNAASGAATPYVWRWERGLPAERSSFRRSARRASRPSSAVASRQNGLWWTEGNGAVLVDGIANDAGLFGRVVDLRGTKQATLSVDRKQLSQYDAQLAHDRSVAAIDDLIDAPGPLSPSWLDALMDEDAELAEAITVRATERAATWSSYDWTLDAGRTGFFQPDLLLLPAVTGSFPWPEGFYDQVAALLILCMPEPLLRWRLRALHPELPLGSLPAARPSDLRLLTLDNHYSWPSAVRDANEAYADAHGLTEIRSSRGKRDVTGLFSELPLWRPSRFTVSQAEVLVSAVRLWRAPHQISARLRAIGYDVADLGPLETASADDLHLLVPLRDPRKTNRSGRRDASPAEFLLPGTCVPLAHLHLQEHPRQATARLEALGYRLPTHGVDRLAETNRLDIATRDLLRAVLHHVTSWPVSADEAHRITGEQLLYVASRKQSEPKDVARTLAGLGLAVPDPEGLPELTPAHHLLSGLSATTRQSFGTPMIKATIMHALTDRDPALLADFGIRPEQLVPHRTRPANHADTAVVWGDPAKQLPLIEPVYLRVVAALSDVPLTTLQSRFRERDYEGGFAEASTHDLLLVQAFQDPDSLPRNPGKGHHAALAQIASAALVLRRPFREVAAKASELGFSHDAQSWWTGQPENTVRSGS